VREQWVALSDGQYCDEQAVLHRSERELQILPAFVTNLEAAFPEQFLSIRRCRWMTDADSDNFLRNAFNERLRDWHAPEWPRVVHIADIEANDSKEKSARPISGTRHARNCCDSYTKDGGHLNDGQGMVAKAFTRWLPRS